MNTYPSSPVVRSAISVVTKWARYGNRQLRNIASQEQADALTSEARRDGEHLAVAPDYYATQRRSIRNLGWVAAFLVVCGVGGLAWLLYAVTAPTPLHYTAAATPFLLGVVLWYRGRLLKQEFLDGYIDAAEYVRARDLAQKLGEDEITPISWGQTLMRPASMMLEATFIALTLQLAAAMVLPAAFSYAVAIAVAIIVSRFAGEAVSHHIALHRKKLYVRTRWNRIRRFGEQDADMADRAKNFRSVTTNFVADKFSPPSRFERIWPYALVVGVGTLIVGLVVFRVYVVDANAIEATGMIIGGVLATTMFGLAAFAEEHSISAGGNAGSRAHAILKLFPNQASLDAENDKHARAVHGWLNTRFHAFAQLLDAMHVGDGDVQYPSTGIALELPFPPESTTSAAAAAIATTAIDRAASSAAKVVPTVQADAPLESSIIILPDNISRNHRAQEAV